MVKRSIVVASIIWAVAAPMAAAQELSGSLGYLQGGAAWVLPLAGGEAAKLPRSDQAVSISLSPQDGSAYFFVPVSQREDEEERFGFTSAKPYTQTRELPPPLQRAKALWTVWSGDGSSAFFGRATGSAGWRLTGGQIKPLPFTAEAASRDGKVLVHTTAKQVLVYQAETGKSRTLFSTGKPEALFNALRRAKPAGALKDVVGAIDPELFKLSSNWAMGQPAVSPDGKTVYLSTNAGTSMGAAGNTTWCLVAIDVKTAKITPLAKLGTFFSRVPHLMVPSPDGKRLMVLSSAHDNAASNPCALNVVDPVAQTRRELLWADKGDKKKEELANLVDGACWSPDSRTIAVSVLFYDAAKAFKDENWSPKEEAYTLCLYDVATRQIVRRIAGGHAPSWSK